MGLFCFTTVIRLHQEVLRFWARGELTKSKIRKEETITPFANTS